MKKRAYNDLTHPRSAVEDSMYGLFLPFKRSAVGRQSPRPYNDKGRYDVYGGGGGGDLKLPIRLPCCVECHGTSWSVSEQGDASHAAWPLAQSRHLLPLLQY